MCVSNLFFLSFYPVMRLVVFISQSENSVSEPKPDAEVSNVRGFLSYDLLFVFDCVNVSVYCVYMYV
jgi:hypothetical protein